MRIHLVVPNVWYTVIDGEQIDSQWGMATLKVFEIQDIHDGIPKSHWGIGIYHGSADAIMVGISSEEFTMDVEEVIGCMAFRKVTPTMSVTYCIRMKDRCALIQLVSLCANIKAYYYATL